MKPLSMSVEEFQTLAAERYLGVTWHAVMSRAMRLPDFIEYTVDVEGGHGEQCVTVFRRLVNFGRADRELAGGADFVAAAREQQKVADLFASVITRGED